MSSRSVRPRPKAIRLPGIAGSLSILLLCACCRCVQAQDVADSPDAIELPAIRVEDSRTPDAANEAGASRLRGEALRDRKGATLGETVGDAQKQAYALASKIKWEGSFYRSDIGYRAINRK